VGGVVGFCLRFEEKFAEPVIRLRFFFGFAVNRWCNGGFLTLIGSILNKLVAIECTFQNCVPPHSSHCRITYIKSTFPEFPLQSQRIAAEYTLSFPSAVDNTKIVSGKADYVLGYGGSSSKELGSILVAIEAKRQSTFSFAISQLVVYLGTFTSLRCICIVCSPYTHFP